MTAHMARYTPGADEFLFVEMDEEMSLGAFFRSLAITSRLVDGHFDGIVDVCPANASFQIQYDPDILAYDDLVAIVGSIEAEVGSAENFELNTRILEIPVLYDDPWTNETLMRFRDRHQAPNATDLEFAAEINGLRSVDEFIERHSGAPWFTSMVGFVAGLPFLYQMVPRSRQLQVPKYLRPRTDTPALTIGHGGCFGCIYSVRGAGGYQMFGITPAPIYDPTQKIAEFKEFMVLMRPGDIVRFKPITRPQYDDIRVEVEANEYRHKTMPWTFRSGDFLSDPDGYNTHLLEVFNDLHG